MRILLLLVAAASLLAGGCASDVEPAVDHATVVAPHASVRLKNSSTSRTIRVLEPGDKIEILEQQEHWYKIRLGKMQGWMEESTVLTNATRVRIEELAASSQSQVPQNTALLRQDTNFRIDPSRTSSVIRKLSAGSRVEVIDRTTLPRPGSDHASDMWLKVRPTPAEAGWLLSTAVDFEVPPDIAQYTEGYSYTVVKPVNQVQDIIAGPIRWYVVGERKPGADPNVDFTGVRVFTWNLKKHRYETAYRTKGMRGVYPLEIGQDGVNPTFRIYVLGDDGKEKKARQFVMYGVIVREKKDDV
jgi:SH3-like domain-containing protein